MVSLIVHLVYACPGSRQSEKPGYFIIYETKRENYLMAANGRVNRQDECHSCVAKTLVILDSWKVSQRKTTTQRYAWSRDRQLAASSHRHNQHVLICVAST